MLARRSLLLATVLAAALGSTAGYAARQDGDGGWSQSGVATWYGGWHAGRRTSSGETFDPRRMTAAHASLPLGSYVRVTVEESGTSIIVRVNDREPARKQRCIDLSQAAAAKLGIVDQGRARVTLAAVSADEASGQAGGDSTNELAEAPDDAVNAADASRDVTPDASRVTGPHGRRHRRHAAQ